MPLSLSDYMQLVTPFPDPGAGYQAINQGVGALQRGQQIAEGRRSNAAQEDLERSRQAAVERAQRWREQWDQFESAQTALQAALERQDKQAEAIAKTRMEAAEMNMADPEVAGAVEAALRARGAQFRESQGMEPIEEEAEEVDMEEHYMTPPEEPLPVPEERTEPVADRAMPAGLLGATQLERDAAMAERGVMPPMSQARQESLGVTEGGRQALPRVSSAIQRPPGATAPPPMAVPGMMMPVPQSGANPRAQQMMAQAQQMRQPQPSSPTAEGVYLPDGTYIGEFDFAQVPVEAVQALTEWADEIASGARQVDREVYAQAKAAIPGWVRGAKGNQAVALDKMEKFIDAELDRRSRERAQQSAASSRGAGFERSDAQEAFAMAKEVAGYDELKSTLTSGKELADALSMTRDKNGWLDAMAIKKIVSAYEKGRISDKDFEIALSGLQGVPMDVRNWLNKQRENALSPEQRRRVTEGIKKMYTNIAGNLDSTRQKLKELRDSWRTSEGKARIQILIRMIPPFTQEQKAIEDAEKAAMGQIGGIGVGGDRVTRSDRTSGVDADKRLKKLQQGKKPVPAELLED